MMHIIKKLYKRLILRKWIFIIVWRVSMMRRTVYPFHDVPYTVLRVIRYAALINVVSDEDKKNEIDQQVYDTFIQMIKLSNEELNIRHFKKHKGIEYAND